MESSAIVVRPGEGARVGNVEFLARTKDTPRFTFGIIELLSACSDDVSAIFHSPAVVALMLPASSDNAMAWGFPTLFARAFDSCTSLSLHFRPVGFAPLAADSIAIPRAIR